MGFSQEELGKNQFLGGKLQIWQPLKGYRAGADPVFLAASVSARAGQSVLELGCGAGVASLCLGRRVSGLELTGVELQSAYADLARLNARENQIALQVVTSDLRSITDPVGRQRFDHVIANPPFFHPTNRTSAKDTGREIALAGGTALVDWINIAIRMLKPRGVLTLIQKPERLPEILGGIGNRLGGIKVKPLVPRLERASGLMIVTAKKGSRSKFVLLSPLILHSGQHHERDTNSYTSAAEGVLRNCQPLKFDF